MGKERCDMADEHGVETVDWEEAKPDPYECPPNFPDCMRDFLETSNRGANAPNAAPQDGDLAKMVAHASEEIEIFVPKTYVKKSMKEGGDPVLLRGRAAFEEMLSTKTWSELAPLTDMNGDGVIDEMDCPVWEPLLEIVAGKRRMSVCDAAALNTGRPGRVFRRRGQSNRRFIDEKFKQTIVVENDQITFMTTTEICARV